MTTPKVGGPDYPINEFNATPNSNSGTQQTGLNAAESETLNNMGGTPEPVGDTAPKRTPQPGEQVKIVAKDARGGKSAGSHYYVYDELGNAYEVDKKTYNSLKKGKGFVDGGQLKPVAEGAPQPIKKNIDVSKGEQSQARREVQRATADAESALKSQQNINTQKEALKKEYDAAKKEMQEAKKALQKAITEKGGDVEAASKRFATANSKFKNVSREYKSILTSLKNAISKTERAVKTMENAKTRSAEITKQRDAAKAAERKAASEAKGTAPKAEGTASKVEEAASKAKGGGKWTKILALGLGIVGAVVGLGLLINNAAKPKNEVDKTDDTIDEKDTQDIDTKDENEIDGEGETEESKTPVTAEEVAAAQADNDHDIADVAADEAMFNEPITVKPDDCVWNICKDQLKEKNNGTEPTNKEIAEAVAKVMEKNVGTLRWESNGYHVMIYPQDTFDADGTYHKHQ